MGDLPVLCTLVSQAHEVHVQPLQGEMAAGTGQHQLAVKLCESTCSGVILICKADLAEEMVNRTGDYGVCVVSKPLNKQELVKALRIGSAFRHRLLTMQKENNKLRTKLEEMRYVSRAKFLLISEQGMTEEAAHRDIEKSAMDTRRTRKEVSLEVIAKYE